MRTPTIVLAAAVLATVAPDRAAAQHIIVKIDGSSTVYPVTEAVAEEFQKQSKGKVKVTVGISGTGGGFKKFCRGETDLTGASRPILKEEMELARQNKIEYVELPICFDALTVVVNPRNTWADYITVQELKTLWEPSAQGKVTRWSQVRPGWPDEKIELFGPGADSGTFDYFTEATVGKAKSSRGDYTASENDNVLVRGVEGNKFALGYFGYAYYASHSRKLKALPIDWEKDSRGPVAPTHENVLNGTYNPLSRPLFIYVNRASLEKPEVRDFVRYYLDNVQTLATEVKYIPLPKDEYPAIKERLHKMQTGTAFGGVPEVGIPIGDLMKRELKK